MIRRLRLLMLGLLLALALPAWAAFPTVITEVSSSQVGDVNTHTMSLPASLVSGNDLVCAVTVDGTITGGTPPTGWTSIIAFTTNNAGGNNVFGAAFHKVSNGGEGASTTFDTTGATQQSVHHCWQISGHDSSTNAPQGTFVGDGGTASLSADPPSLTPTGGAKDYLWLAVGGKDRGALTFNAFPASYTNTGEQNQSGTDSAGVCIAWGRRALNAASEDPAAFTFPTTNRNTVAMTIAVHPGAEGGAGASSAFNPMNGRGGAAAQPVIP